MTTQRKISQAEFDHAYELHQMWAYDDPNGGSRMNFANCDLSGIVFPESAYLVDANFENTSFRNTVLDKVYFLGCNLRNADFEGATMNEVDFEGAELY